MAEMHLLPVGQHLYKEQKMKVYLLKGYFLRKELCAHLIRIESASRC